MVEATTKVNVTRRDLKMLRCHFVGRRLRCVVYELGHGLVSDTDVLSAVTRTYSSPASLLHYRAFPPSLRLSTRIVPVAANNDLFQVLARWSQHDNVGKREVEGKGGENDGLEGSGFDIFQY